MRNRRAFTLVELLTVIAIIAILAAILFPVIREVRNAAHRGVATKALGQVMMAASMYMGDADDTFPLGVYRLEDGQWQMWCARQGPDGRFNPDEGTLKPYMKGSLKDPAHQAAPYLGDGSGFGYNWGYLGGETNITLDYSAFPNCNNPARGSQLGAPSRTIVFATSAYYFAPWWHGDGQTYDFAFIDPPRYWRNNPNVDFRHNVSKRVDLVHHYVEHRGWALFAFSDGSAKGFKKTQVKNAWFEREGKEDPGPENTE